MLSKQIGVALENAQLFERHQSLYTYLYSVQTRDEFAATLRSLTTKAASLLGCAHVCIYLHAPLPAGRGHQLVSRFTEGLPDFALQLNCRSVAAAVLSRGEPTQVDEPSHSRLWSPEVDLRTGFRTRSILCAPLLMPGSASRLGVIEALNKNEGRFDGAAGGGDARLLSVFGSIASMVLHAWHTAESQHASSTRHGARQALCGRLSALIGSTRSTPPSTTPEADDEPHPRSAEGGEPAASQGPARGQGPGASQGPAVPASAVLALAGTKEADREGEQEEAAAALGDVADGEGGPCEVHLATAATELHELCQPSLLHCEAFRMLLVEGADLLVQDGQFRTVRYVRQVSGTGTHTHTPLLPLARP